MTAPPCLPPREVTPPKVSLPPNACDTHAHVFGPSDRFPYADDRSYTPPDAPLAKYLGMLDALGFARGVLVQGSVHGVDQIDRALLAFQRDLARLHRAARDEHGRDVEAQRGHQHAGRDLVAVGDAYHGVGAVCVDHV